MAWWAVKPGSVDHGPRGNARKMTVRKIWAARQTMPMLVASGESGRIS